MILACAAFTKRGRKMTEHLFTLLPDLHPMWRQKGESLADFAGTAFYYHLPVLFTGAAGIAVRAIAPYVKDKLQDSAVLVMDEEGRYVIPLLSGHAGGANDLAVRISAAAGAVPVITTASDVQHTFSCDVFAVRNHLAIRDREGIRIVTEKLLERGKITICIEPGIRLPKGPLPGFFERVPYPLEDEGTRSGKENGSGKGKGRRHITGDDAENKEGGCIEKCSSKEINGEADIKEENTLADLLIACDDRYSARASLCLVPKTLYLGIGCRKGKSFEELYAFEKKVLVQSGALDPCDKERKVETQCPKSPGFPKSAEIGESAEISKASGEASKGQGSASWDTPEETDTGKRIRMQAAAIASIDLKADEPGLEILAQYQHLPFVTYTSKELREVQGDFAISKFVEETTGVSNVCERAAVLAAGEGAKLLVRKRAENGMTIAVAKGRPVITTWDTEPGEVCGGRR